MSQALQGVRVLDFTHVQSGPTCTQLLGWLGADVIKIERPGSGDITRSQLRDIPDVDSLYFTILNANKKSVALDVKTDAGKTVLADLIVACDVMVENFAPGALARMGFDWPRIQALNPKLILASIKGFGPGPNENAKVYENVAQCIGGAAATTGFRDGPPTVTSAQIGDAGTGLNLAIGILAALYQRTTSGRGQRVDCAMQDGVLSLCRVKLRDQQRLQRGPLVEYSQHGQGIPFGATVPRAGNDSGGGQPGWIVRCLGFETDANAYVYVVTQAQVWGEICAMIGAEDWAADPAYATPEMRHPKLTQIFERIETWTQTKTKFEVMADCTARHIPCGPVMSIEELAEDPDLVAAGTIVAVEHPTRGSYLTVGNPIRLSDSPTDMQRAPLLGEHTEAILRDVLGYDAAHISRLANSGVTTAKSDDG